MIQIEEFGVSVWKDGSVLYGLQVTMKRYEPPGYLILRLQIESVMDRLHHHLSLDHISRLLIDIHMVKSLVICT